MGFEDEEISLPQRVGEGGRFVVRVSRGNVDTASQAVIIGVCQFDQLIVVGGYNKLKRDFGQKFVGGGGRCEGVTENFGDLLLEGFQPVYNAEFVRDHQPLRRIFCNLCQLGLLCVPQDHSFVGCVFDERL